MYKKILADIIVSTFDSEVGKWQTNNPEQKALLVSFHTKDLERDADGYRYMDLLIYSHANYVQVFCRRQWNVLWNDSVENYDEDDIGITIKKGHDYLVGQSEWVQIANHSSCWTEGVETFLNEFEQDLNFLNKPIGTNAKWYQIIKVPQLPEKPKLWRDGVRPNFEIPEEPR